MVGSESESRDYGGEVVRRLEHVIEFVLNFRAGRPSAVCLPLWSLRLLMEESKRLGDVEVWTLCRQVEEDLTLLPFRNREEDERFCDLLRKAAELRERVGGGSGSACSDDRVGRSAEEFA